MNTTPIYYESSEHARQYGELEQLRASNKADTDCRNLIDQAIGRHFDGMHLAQQALAEVLNEYTPERVAMILAVTVRDRAWDGRFSRKNKEWAEGLHIPPESPVTGYVGKALRSHSAIVNGYVDMFRREVEA